MSIYSIANSLKTCLQPFVVRSCCSDTIELNELIDIMSKGRTTLSKPDITGCMQLMVEELVKLVADGKHVKTPLGAFYLSASGKLETKNQSFTPGSGALDHALTLHFRTNKTVESEMKSKARWERIESFDTTAAVIDAITVVGRSAGEAARSGDTLRIAGRRMKFDPEDASCGLFLDSDSGDYRAVVYPDINPSKLIAILPPGIPAGKYDLVIATKPNGKDLKEGYYDEAFVIA